jgi:hypothetical protein
MIGSITEDKIRQRFLQASLRVSFSTEVLPYRYPGGGRLHFYSFSGQAVLPPW